MTLKDRSGAALVRALFLEGFSKNNPSVLKDVLAEDFILTSAGAIAEDGLTKNGTRQNLLDGMAHNHRCFTNWNFNIETLCEAESQVTARWTARGIHTGSFAGEVPTDKEVILKGLSLYQIANSHIVQDWVFADQVSFGEQLGLNRQPQIGSGEALVREFWEDVINAHNPNVADKIMAPHYRQHSEGIAQGPAGFKEFLNGVLKNSKGMTAKVNAIVDVGDVVISSTDISFEQAPEGWAKLQTIVDVFRTDGRRLTEHWDLHV